MHFPYSKKFQNTEFVWNFHILFFIGICQSNMTEITEIIEKEIKATITKLKSKNKKN